MIKIKLLTIALSSALGVGGVTAASTQWKGFNGPTFDGWQAGNKGHGKGNDGKSSDGKSNDGNSGGGNHFGIGSCGD